MAQLQVSQVHMLAKMAYQQSVPTKVLFHSAVQLIDRLEYGETWMNHLEPPIQNRDSLYIYIYKACAHVCGWANGKRTKRCSLSQAETHGFVSTIIVPEGFTNGHLSRGRPDMHIVCSLIFVLKASRVDATHHNESGP